MDHIIIYCSGHKKEGSRKECTERNWMGPNMEVNPKGGRTELNYLLGRKP